MDGVSHVAGDGDAAQNGVETMSATSETLQSSDAESPRRCACVLAVCVCVCEYVFGLVSLDCHEAPDAGVVAIVAFELAFLLALEPVPERMSRCAGLLQTSARVAFALAAMAAAAAAAAATSMGGARGWSCMWGVVLLPPVFGVVRVAWHVGAALAGAGSSCELDSVGDAPLGTPDTVA